MKHPLDPALDDRLGFVGTSGSGKTYNAGGGVERLLDRKARAIITDPLGVWWGLRLLADGKTASPYDVVIFGGPRGDLPLNEHAGALIGETVAGMSESSIVDLTQLGTKAAERRFMLDFLTALYKHASGEPVHLIIDEADMFAPQRPTDRDVTESKLLGMMETVVRRGRIKGFIPWLITQRPAVLNKNVLSQVDGLVAFKLTSSQDRKALGAWIEGQADVEQGKEILAALPAMQVGEGVVWVPTRGILETVAFPEKATFDSSRAPKRGKKQKRTAALKPLDVDALKGRLASVEQEAKANDPKELKAEIARLRNELRAKPAPAAPAAHATQNREAIREAKQQAAQLAATVTALRKALEAAMKFIIEINAKDFFKAGGEAIDKAAIEKAIADATRHITGMLETKLERRNRELDSLRKQGQRVIERLKGLLDEDVTVQVDVRHNEPFTVTEPSPRPTHVKRAAYEPAGDGQAAAGLTRAKQRILDAIAWMESIGAAEASRDTVAFLADQSSRSSGYANNLGALRTAGLIDYAGPGTVVLTEEGRALANRPTDALDHETIMAKVAQKLPAAQMRILGAAAAAYPNPIDRAELAERAEQSATSSGYANNLGRLRKLGLLTYPGGGTVRAADRLFP